MTTSSMTTSEALAALISILPSNRKGGEVCFQSEAYAALVLGLMQVQRMAVAMERELGAFRTLEAARFAKGEMEEVALDAQGGLVLDADGNVITVKFGGR